MTEQFQEIQTLLTEMFSGIVASTIQFTPKLIGALVVLLIGWMLGRVLRAISERAVSGWLDALLERTGITRAIEQSAMSATPSSIVGRVFFWLVMLVFIMAASKIMGIDAIADAITRFMAYIPSVVGAALGHSDGRES